MFDYHQGGQPLDPESEGYSIVLRKPWTVNTTTRVAKGEEMVIRVEKGSMRFKLGQFDSFEF